MMSIKGLTVPMLFVVLALINDIRLIDAIAGVVSTVAVYETLD